MNTERLAFEGPPQGAPELNVIYNFEPPQSGIKTTRLIGTPGAGKTTLAQELNSRYPNVYSTKEPYQVLRELREAGEATLYTDFQTHMFNSTRIDGIPISEYSFPTWFKDGSWIDELPAQAEIALILQDCAREEILHNNQKNGVVVCDRTYMDLMVEWPVTLYRSGFFDADYDRFMESTLDDSLKSKSLTRKDIMHFDANFYLIIDQLESLARRGRTIDSKETIMSMDFLSAETAHYIQDIFIHLNPRQGHKNVLVSSTTREESTTELLTQRFELIFANVLGIDSKTL